MKIKTAIRNTLNSYLKLFGFKMVRMQPGSSPELIDPIERNKKETLDNLWSDTQFLKDYLNPRRSKLYNEVIQVAQSKGYLVNSKTVADVGCGPGYFLRFLVDNGFQGNLHGYDFSDSAVEQGRGECPKASFFKHDIYNNLDLHFDLLFCMETLEHLNYPERALRNLLNASDVVILTVPDGRKDSFRGHINFWSMESWKIFLQNFANEESIFFKMINNNTNLLAIIESKKDRLQDQYELAEEKENGQSVNHNYVVRDNTNLNP